MFYYCEVKKSIFCFNLNNFIYYSYLKRLSQSFAMEHALRRSSPTTLETLEVNPLATKFCVSYNLKIRVENVLPIRSVIILKIAVEGNVAGFLPFNWCPFLYSERPNLIQSFNDITAINGSTLLWSYKTSLQLWCNYYCVIPEKQLVIENSHQSSQIWLSSYIFRFRPNKHFPK